MRLSGIHESRNEAQPSASVCARARVCVCVCVCDRTDDESGNVASLGMAARGRWGLMSSSSVVVVVISDVHNGGATLLKALHFRATQKAFRATPKASHSSSSVWAT